MANIKITVEYDGTDYCGWQYQKNTAKTIQYQLEKALSRINKSPVRVHGAGRTDAGVHALGQTANFELDVVVPVERIPLALNSELPGDIICKSAQEVSPFFHARYDAVAKKYQYRFSNNRFPSVFNRRFVYNIYKKMDIDKVISVIGQLAGQHDFSSFQASGSDISNSVRTIKKISLQKKRSSTGVEYRLDVLGDGFLYNMVRIISGTLIEIALDKREPDLEGLLAAKNRKKAGFTAPAKALTLLEVFY